MLIQIIGSQNKLRLPKRLQAVRNLDLISFFYWRRWRHSMITCRQTSFIKPASAANNVVGVLCRRSFSSLPSRPDQFPNNNGLFRISSSLKDAIKENEAVVALESAIITHGMPFPQNIELALKMENIIKQKGVIPATVGVIKGQLVVGLSEHEIEFLGTPSKTKNITATHGNSQQQRSKQQQQKSDQIVKVSRRDLPYVLSQKINGGTTVSGTIVGAVKAGIPIFATGGLGGVHRCAEKTFDISADLKELGRNSIAVVAAGIKSILDIGKTLEYLETEGVCVVVMKRKPDLESNHEDISSSIDHEASSIKFPSFFTAESQFGCPYMIQDEVQGAKLIHSVFALGLQSGILIAVPIPKEFEASGVKIERAIELSLEKAKKLGIEGRGITPFLLREINLLTSGESLEANKHLVENNVQVASEIAIQLAKIRKSTAAQRSPNNDNNNSHINHKNSNSNSNGQGSNTFNNQTVLHTSILKNIGETRKAYFHTESTESIPIQTEQEVSNNSFNSSSSIVPMPIDDEYKISFNESKSQSSCNDNENSNSIHDDICLDLTSSQGQRNGPPVVIGGSSVDLVLALEEDKIVMDGRTHTTKINSVPGGVARNIAEALHKFGYSPFFISAIGNDLFGAQLIKDFEVLKMNTQGILISTSSPSPMTETELPKEISFTSEEEPEKQEKTIIKKKLEHLNDSSASNISTAIYSMILSRNGECLFGLGDMNIHSQISSDHIQKFEEILKKAPIVVLDTNITVQALTTALKICTENCVPVWLEPTEVRKVKKVLQVPQPFWPCIKFISPNLKELISLSEEQETETMDHNRESSWNEIEEQAAPRSVVAADMSSSPSSSKVNYYVKKCFTKFSGLEIILLTKGQDGFSVFHRVPGQLGTNSSSAFSQINFSAPAFNKNEVIRSVSGSGDCLNAGIISGLLSKLTLKESCLKGTSAAKKCLLSIYNVPDSF